MTSATMALLSFVFAASAQQSPHDLYERARMLDASNQNLAEAIRLYSQFISIAKDDRPRAAKAQYRIGDLHARLGHKADAQRAYAKLISLYPDQMDLAQRARTKLAALASARPREMLITKAAPSPDGLFTATFTFPSRVDFSSPAVDATGRRLYLFTRRLRPLGTDAESRRAARRGLRQVYDPSTLVVIDLDSLSIIKTLPLPFYVGTAEFNPATNKLYAAAKADGFLIAIDAVTLSQQKIFLGGFPHDVAVNAKTNRIYVSSDGFAGNDKLFVIDGATNSVVARCDLDGGAGFVLVNPSTNRVYASTGDPAKTRVFDGSDNSPIEDLPSKWVVAADPEASRLYALSAGLSGTTHAAIALDASTHRQLATLAAGDQLGSRGVATDLVARRIYVALLAENQIAAIDAASGVETDRFSISSPIGIVLDPRTGRMFVSQYGAAGWMLSVLDPRFVSEAVREEFVDEFESETLDPAWKVVTRGRGHYSLTENPGYLRYRVDGRSPGTGDATTVLARKFRGDHWTLEAKSSYAMGVSGGGRSLTFSIAFGTPAGIAPIAIAFVLRSRGDWNGCCPGGTAVELNLRNVSGASKESPPNQSDSYVWRVRRNGRTITVERSDDDGIDFVTEATNVFGPQIDGVIQYLCITGDSHANYDAYGDFDYVRLTKEPEQEKVHSQRQPLNH
jgi:DNA-binding beta-propeller fold protein YncE